MVTELKVICIKTATSTKLIKGATYIATAIYSYSTTKTVRLKDLGMYNIDYFTDINGTPLRSYPDFNDYDSESKLKLDDINYAGQYVKCRYSSSKFLTPGEIYFVEKHTTEKIPYHSYSGGRNYYYEHKFKFRGIKNYYKIHSNFLEIPMMEQRKIKLKNLKGEKIKTGDKKRKFLNYSEKEKNVILFKLITSVINDIKSIEIDGEIDIAQLVVNKGKTYHIKKEDVLPFLNNSVIDNINTIK